MREPRSQPRAVVVANLRARGLGGSSVRSAATLDELRAIARRRDAQLHTTRDVNELDDIVRAARTDGAPLIVFAGGDGSFMQGVSALLRTSEQQPSDLALPRVGLAPFGTVGTTARNLVAVRGGARGALAAVDRWLTDPSGPTQRTPTLRIRETSEGTTRDRFGWIFGTGLVARFFEVYEAGGATGIPLAGRIVARIFAESIVGGPLAKRVLTPMACKLRIGDRTLPAPGYSLLCAALVRDLGLGMKVSYRAGERSDRVHLVASSLSPGALGPRMPYVLLGRSIGGRDHVDELVEQFEVEFVGRSPTTFGGFVHDGPPGPGVEFIGGSVHDGPPGPGVELRSTTERGAYVLDGDTFRADKAAVSLGPSIELVGAQPQLSPSSSVPRDPQRGS